MAEPTSALNSAQSNELVAVQVITEPPPPTLVRTKETISTRAYSTVDRGYQSARSGLLRVLRRSRQNFRYLAKEKPVELVAGVGLIAVLTGVGLRVWRRRYE